jgi:hypothetical protein
VRFVDFLKTFVLLCAAAATALAVVTIAGASSKGDTTAALVAVGWWAVAAIIGVVLGRRPVASPAIARLLADSRASRTLPELRPGSVLLNRLWSLLVFTLVSGAIAFVIPQVPGIAAGFAIIWALAWRRQESAVTAIEDRDGMHFYVRHTSPLKAMALERVPGMRAVLPAHPGAST